MNDGVAEFQTGGIAIVDDSPNFIFQDGDEFREFHDVLLGAVNGGGEMAVQAARGFQNLLLLRVADEKRFRTEDFIGEIGAGEKRSNICLK